MRATFVLLVLASAFLASAQEPVMPVRQTHSVYKSGGKTVNVDIFAPPGEAQHPAVLVLHGSAGINRIDDFHAIAKYFAGHGYLALFPHYLDVSGMSSVPSLSDMTPARFERWE